jgi:hypothetical protein
MLAWALQKEMDVHLWCSCLPAGRGQPAARYMHAGGDRESQETTTERREEIKHWRIRRTRISAAYYPCLHCISVRRYVALCSPGRAGGNRSIDRLGSCCRAGESTGLCVCARPDACRRRARALTWIAHVWIQRAISYWPTRPAALARSHLVGDGDEDGRRVEKSAARRARRMSPIRRQWYNSGREDRAMIKGVLNKLSWLIVEAAVCRLDQSDLFYARFPPLLFHIIDSPYIENFMLRCMVTW